MFPCVLISSQTFREQTGQVPKKNISDISTVTCKGQDFFITEKKHEKIIAGTKC